LISFQVSKIANQVLHQKN